MVTIVLDYYVEKLIHVQQDAHTLNNSSGNSSTPLRRDSKFLVILTLLSWMVRGLYVSGV